MTPRLIALLLATAVLAAAAGWTAAQRFQRAARSGDTSAAASATRKILFYQSAMHPWIKSDQPGKCTICGMDLTPVFEGDAAMPLDPGLVALGSNAISVLNVHSVTLQRGPLQRTLRVAGTLEDDDTRHRFISAAVAGRIEDLFVTYVGAEVTAGQPLARFYSPMLLEAERQFLALNASPAHEATRPDLEILRSASATRLLQLGLTELQIQQLASKHPTNAFSEIVAPASGTVVERFVFPGQYVMEGEKLFEIADFSTLWFLFDAYEQDLPWLELGQELDVSSPAAPGKTFRAPIRFIDPNISDMTRSAKIRVEVPNPVLTSTPSPRRALPHRAFAEGLIRLVVPDVLLVPRSAILSPAQNPVVYLDRGEGLYEQRAIRLGRLGDTDYEVLEGLAPDDRVVVQGNLLIDAQAQLNQTLRAAEEAGHSQAHPVSQPAAPTPLPAELSAEQSSSLRKFLTDADALRTALADDDLPAFHRATESIGPGLEALRQTLSAQTTGIPWAERLPRSAPSGTHSDLRAARKAYHAFSIPLVALAKELRSHATSFKDLKIFRCPMTAEAFEGAPARAEWMQLSSPLRNPWFGAEMLECGVEVRD
jgi:Cu(I)/Ag(I) efflux system membrane fusion protein